MRYLEKRKIEARKFLGGDSEIGVVNSFGHIEHCHNGLAYTDCFSSDFEPEMQEFDIVCFDADGTVAKNIEILERL